MVKSTEVPNKKDKKRFVFYPSLQDLIVIDLLIKKYFFGNHGKFGILMNGVISVADGALGKNKEQIFASFTRDENGLPVIKKDIDSQRKAQLARTKNLDKTIKIDF